MTARLAMNDGPQDAYHDFDTIVDDIHVESVYTLECDSTQPHYLSDLMNEEDTWN